MEYPLIEPNKPHLQNLMPNTLSVGIFGHVDSGKSTLLGHLFYKLNIINQKEYRKH